eukprot:5982673-Pyramimonas_sp.AAC.1
MVSKTALRHPGSEAPQEGPETAQRGSPNGSRRRQTGQERHNTARIQTPPAIASRARCGRA